MNNLYLAHHGVKGMKWGVRKKRDDSGIGGKLRKLGGSLRTTTGDNGMSAQPKRPKNTTNWDQPESAIKIPTISITSGKNREARARYKADVNEAVEKAKAAGDDRSAKKMQAVVNPRKAAIKNIATGVATGVASSVVAEAGRQALEKKLYSDLPKSSITSGEMMSLNIMNGALGGTVTGVITTRKQYKDGVKIASEKYGIDVADYKPKK